MSDFKILSISFNEDQNSCIVNSNKNLKIYTISHTESSLTPIYENPELKNAKISCRLMSSSLLVVVTISNPKILKVIHFRKNVEIASLSYSSNIINLKVNRSNLVVVCEHSIYFHDIKDMKMLQVWPWKGYLRLILRSRSEASIVLARVESFFFIWWAYLRPSVIP